MKYGKALALGMMLVAGAAWMPGPARAADDGRGGVAKVRLMIQKLNDSMAGLKDLDSLERAGMPKKDVDRMRRAMQRKINQMIEETIARIQAM